MLSKYFHQISPIILDSNNVLEDEYFDGLDAYREATEKKEISLRVNSSQYASPSSWRKDLEYIKKRRFINSQGSMNTVKIFADGVIEAGTGALLDPYLGCHQC